MNKLVIEILGALAVPLAAMIVQFLLFYLMRSDSKKRLLKETYQYFEIYYPSGIMWLGVVCCLVMTVIPLMMVLPGGDINYRELFICLGCLFPIYLAGIALIVLPNVQVIAVDDEGLLIKSFLKKDLRLRYEEIDYAELRVKGDGEKLFIYRHQQEKPVLKRDNLLLTNLDRLAEKFAEKNIRFYD